MIYKGFAFGYTISVIIAVMGIGKGSLFSFSTLFLQNLLEIPALFAIAVSGIRIYKVIIKNRRRENIKIELIRHTVISLLFFNVLIIESFISGYISTLIAENLTKIL